MRSRPPDACDWAFKEWVGVRDAVASGRQMILLRKGGVHEGPGGFTPDHSAFWLYPTVVHQTEQGLSDSPPPPRSTFGCERVSIDTLITLEAVARLDRFEEVEALRGEHVWTPETIRARFDYRRPGLWLLAARAWVSPEAWDVEVLSSYHGCKTWVPLADALSANGTVPTLDETTFAARLDRIARLLPEDRLAPVTEVG